MAISLSIGILTLGVSLGLLATSIADMVYYGEDMAYWRRCINFVFWTLNITSAVSFSLTSFLDLGNFFERDGSTGLAMFWVLEIIGIASQSAVFVLSTVLIVMSHRKMRKVRLHPIACHAHACLPVPTCTSPPPPSPPPRAYVYVHVCMCACVFVCLCACVCVYVCTVRVYMYMLHV